MNRIELIALFKSLKRLCDKEDLEGLKDVVETVLNEAQREKD